MKIMLSKRNINISTLTINTFRGKYSLHLTGSDTEPAPAYLPPCKSRNVIIVLAHVSLEHILSNMVKSF